MAPLFLSVLWIGRARFPTQSSVVVLGSTVIILCGHALFSALSHAQISSTDPICDALTQRGIHPAICEGAISYLDKDSSHGLKKVADKFLNTEALPDIALLMGLALLAPIIFVLQHHIARTVALATALSGAALLPLFFVAVDWGRFVSVQIFGFSVLMMVGYLTGAVREKRQITPGQILVCLVIGLIFSIGHVKGVSTLGALSSLYLILQ
ncbi:hypothetical protein [Aliiroseovarius halocynthiae]|uniref:Uncharacterized protein n=2 Tax=Aliiroseovarius halocynthiae TaxID=985055 RepID=A0A545SM62_9RHOB|nr:hypothetical protein [Aliiroseovarius halocynthiae]TQV66061.1 hypothetical protein FIL88_14925 [Aliiroseovarius halocynthiae]